LYTLDVFESTKLSKHLAVIFSLSWELKVYMHACSSETFMCCCRLKDALKQVQYLQSSHRDSSSHHSVLQEQMHKLSGKVSQATHFLGGGKG